MRAARFPAAVPRYLVLLFSRRLCLVWRARIARYLALAVLLRRFACVVARARPDLSRVQHIMIFSCFARKLPQCLLTLLWAHVGYIAFRHWVGGARRGR